MHSFGFGL